MAVIRITQLAKISFTIIQTLLVVDPRFILRISLLPPSIVTLHISQMRPLWQIIQVLPIVVHMVIVTFMPSLFVGLAIQLVMLLKKLSYRLLLNQGIILAVMGQLKMVIMKLRLLLINLNILM